MHEGKYQFRNLTWKVSNLDRNYTVFGKVIKGMEFVDLIKRGEGSNGKVSNPDRIISLSAE